jgi:hypothetical protein
MTPTANAFVFAIALATVASLAITPTVAQERKGILSHPPLLKMLVPDTANQEVAV